MNKKQYSLLFLFSLLILIQSGCSTGSGEKKSSDNSVSVPKVTEVQPVIGSETALLLKDLKENGDYVNSQVFPSLIKASVVHSSLGKNILVVDLRSPKLYSEGHIKGSVNKRFEDLPDYFETGIKPFEYDKIIMVCEDGQISSYTTCLLRLMGYGNIYAMRWGMCAWNSTYAKMGWLKDVSGKHEAELETKVNEKPVVKGMPDLGTGKTTGEEIGADRFHKLFGQGTANILISADEVFSDPR